MIFIRKLVNKSMRIEIEFTLTCLLKLCIFIIIKNEKQNQHIFNRKLTLSEVLVIIHKEDLIIFISKQLVNKLTIW